MQLFVVLPRPSFLSGLASYPCFQTTMHVLSSEFSPFLHEAGCYGVQFPAATQSFVVLLRNVLLRYAYAAKPLLSRVSLADLDASLRPFMKNAGEIPGHRGEGG
jgi:hypothetical protein